MSATSTVSEHSSQYRHSLQSKPNPRSAGGHLANTIPAHQAVLAAVCNVKLCHLQERGPTGIEIDVRDVDGHVAL